MSSHHVLQRAFGDAYIRRENVRHATLLSAPRVVCLGKTGAGEDYDYGKNNLRECHKSIER